MAKKDDWITWGSIGLGALVAVVLGYNYITSQKAGAACPKCGATEEQMEQKKEEGGCGCGMDANQQQQQAQQQIV